MIEVIIPIFFFLLTLGIIYAMYMSGRNTIHEPQIEKPEDFFSDCEGDVVKMADKFLADYNARTFGELFYLQKELIKEQRKCLTKH